MTPDTPLYLDKPHHANAVAEAIVHGWAVIPYGATYGIGFHPDRRLEVAEARDEDLNALATVSIVANYQDAIGWLDKDQLHPRLQEVVDFGSLQIYERICFIRYPVNEIGRQQLHPHCINSQGETQVFFVPPSDPIITSLKTYHHTDYYAVRSSNKHGDSEKYTLEEAKELAKVVKALAVAALGMAAPLIEPMRERVMSQPILELMAGQPVIKLVRAGNTHPETMRRLSRNITDFGVEFVHEEEKPKPFTRPQFSSSYENPLDIRRHILRATGLLLY